MKSRFDAENHKNRDLSRKTEIIAICRGKSQISRFVAVNAKYRDSAPTATIFCPEASIFTDTDDVFNPLISTSTVQLFREDVDKFQHCPCTQRRGVFWCETQWLHSLPRFWGSNPQCVESHLGGGFYWSPSSCTRSLLSNNYRWISIYIFWISTLLQQHRAAIVSFLCFFHPLTFWRRMVSNGAKRRMR